MFSGDWKEKDQKEIELIVPDSKITREALDTAFGYLYSDIIEVDQSTAESVLAAASLIQFEGLMQACSQVMLETVSSKNVSKFYESSRLYGQQIVENNCVTWLENNIMLQAMRGTHIAIENELMIRILSSSKLFVIQVEMDVYAMLRKWMLLQMVKKNTFLSKPVTTSKQDTKSVKKYFRDRFAASGECFLETEEGKEYLEVFKQLRLSNILRDYGCCKEVEADGILPKSMIWSFYRQRWQEMLKVESGVDKGPTNQDHLDKNSLRCGRQIVRDIDHCWRWNGYNFGVDILVSYSSKSPRTFTLKRNVESHHCVSSVSLTQKRGILFSLKVFCLDAQGHITYSKTSEEQHLLLDKDEEVKVLVLDVKAPVKLPLYVSAIFKTTANKEINVETV